MRRPLHVLSECEESGHVRYREVPAAVLPHVRRGITVKLTPNNSKYVILYEREHRTEWYGVSIGILHA